MTHVPTERLNIAEYFLDARVQEGLGKHPALLTEAGALAYVDVQDLANRFGRILLDSGVEPEHRVLIALPDVPEFAGAIRTRCSGSTPASRRMRPQRFARSTD